MAWSKYLTPRNITIGSVVITGALLFVILMPLSFKQVAFDEYGIKYHAVSRELDDEVEEEGRYHVQVGEKFFTFKRRVVTVNFIAENSDANNHAIKDAKNYGSVTCMSKDGVVVETSDTFQYQLRQDHVYSLFEMFGTDYEEVIVKMARASIRDACGEYTVEHFYTNRGGIQLTMLNKTQASLETINVDCTNLQLLNAQLPSRYEIAVAEKEEARADVNQAMIEREQVLIRSQTEVLEAREDAKVTVLQAEAEADGILATAQLEATAIEEELTEKAQIYKSIMDSLNLSPEELINYMSIEQLESAERVSISVKSPGKFSYPNDNV